MQLVFSAKRLVEECEARGLTADELARRARCSTSAVYKWRRGVTAPGANGLAALALAIGLPLEDFYTVVPAPDPEGDPGATTSGAA